MPAVAFMVVSIISSLTKWCL